MSVWGSSSTTRPHPTHKAQPLASQQPAPSTQQQTQHGPSLLKIRQLQRPNGSSSTPLQSPTSINESIHPLRYTWVMYFSSPSSRKSSSPTSHNNNHHHSNQHTLTSQLRRIGAFSTIEDFWTMYINLIPITDIPTTPFSYKLFKAGVKPPTPSSGSKSVDQSGSIGSGATSTTQNSSSHNGTHAIANNNTSNSSSGGGKWVIPITNRASSLQTLLWEDLLFIILGDLMPSDLLESQITGIGITKGLDDWELEVYCKDAMNGPRNLRVRTEIRRCLGVHPDTRMEYII